MSNKPDILPGGSLPSELLFPPLATNWPADAAALGAVAEHGLPNGQVHIWAVPLDVTAPTRSKLEGLLTPAERDRAARFRFEVHRNRFIVGRAAMRSLLGAYLNTEPGNLAFVYGPNGKPALSAGGVNTGLHFNLAHSEDLALFAITRSGDVGVDLERIRGLDDAGELVRRFFSVSEARQFGALDQDLQPAAFFNLWTRKEAWLKATGEGIAHSLNRVEVSFVPGAPARLEQLPSDLGRMGDWSLHELVPARGFVGALAVRTASASLQCRSWAWPSGSESGNPKISL